MKKQLSIPVIVAVVIGAVALIGFLYSKTNTGDNVQTGTKTGYDEKNMPAPPSFSIPPAPEGQGGPTGGSVPPPADSRPPQGR